MAVTLKLRQALIVDDNVVVGNKNVDKTITLTAGGHFKAERIIADNYGEAVLWATGEGGMDTFTHGFIFSDQDLWIELRNDEAGADFILMFVPANMLIPLSNFSHGGGSSELIGTDLVENTDYDSIDQIEVHRDEADAVGDANVELHLFN